MKYYKYQAAGNDFILLPALDQPLQLRPEEIIRLCNRRYGIGADGLILLEPPCMPGTDFSMTFYNNDASSGMMCGNGGRCIVDLASRLKIRPSGPHGEWVFTAADGLHQGKLLCSEGRTGRILLTMNAVCGIETVPDPESTESQGIAYKMNTGTDHLVLFRRHLRDLSSSDIERQGRTWRYSPLFVPAGVNVNFVEKDNGLWRIRTYEKGVEYETLSCGTGVIAAAVACYLSGHQQESYTIEATSDTFRVNFRHQNGRFEDVQLEGPVELVFEAYLE